MERNLPLEERGIASGLIRWSLAFAFVAKKQLRVENVSSLHCKDKEDIPSKFESTQNDKLQLILFIC